MFGSLGKVNVALETVEGLKWRMGDPRHSVSPLTFVGSESAATDSSCNIERRLQHHSPAGKK
jgi:hypothetical protein